MFVWPNFASGEDPSTATIQVRRDLPISIESEQLEAMTKSGQRKFLFKGNVRVVQGDVTLRAQEIEAFYPSGSDEPDRLVARRDVSMVQNEKKVRCDEAVYDRIQDKLTCTGKAVMEQGSDRLVGEKIEFEIQTGVVRAFGDVQVDISPRTQAAASSAQKGSAPPVAAPAAPAVEKPQEKAP